MTVAWVRGDVLGMSPTRVLASSFLTTLLLAGCSDSGDTGGGAPAAPSGLAASPLGGGAHVTWDDNASNETEYMVMRMEEGVDTEYEVIATLPFDSEAYHDAPLTSGSTYMYMVMAMNDEGEAESSEITFDAP